MKAKLKPIREQVILITGASSGIGLRTAQLAAERGAKVILVARNEEALRDVTEEITRRGGQAIWFTADVANRTAVFEAANRAIDQFGTIDTWVNNAGVGVWGMSEETPIDEAKQVFETNFWGLVYGTRTALSILEGPGAIINMGSVESERAMPLHSFYAASKHAIKGYTDAVRMEVEKQGRPVAITLVKPASIDTPFIDHARNLMPDSSPSYMSPVYSADLVAEAILDCAVHARREVTIGGAGRALQFFESIAPRWLDRFLELTAFRAQSRPGRHPGAHDNLQQLRGREGQVEGSFDGYVSQTSISTTASLHPLKTLAGMLAVSGLGVMFYRWITQDLKSSIEAQHGVAHSRTYAVRRDLKVPVDSEQFVHV